MKKTVIILGAALALMACGKKHEAVSLSDETPTIRIATFNVSMFRDSHGQLIEDLSQAGDPQVEAVAAIIREVNPDILFLNEFDYDIDGVALEAFQANYLATGETPISYPYSVTFSSNTGISSGVDLDNNGEAVTEQGARAYGNDAFGYGTHEGQYAFAVLSRFPLDEAHMRSFQTLLWKDMPGNVLPTDYYSAEAQDVFRLSSKNHVDMPVDINGKQVHLLLSHPTPPTFDGPEDRNGKRNHDEIKLWADYIDPAKSSYLVDDKGVKGGLARETRFVIMGDMNADPNDGDSYNQAIRQLTDNALVQDTLPSSAGGVDAATRQGGANASHIGQPENDTADFRDEGNNAIGNLRIDYVLPSKFGLKVKASHVFWPAANEPNFDLVGVGFPPISSDHRMVWIDVIVE